MAEDGNGQEGVMRIGKRCYVSNLAWKTSWQDLKDKFRECGNVVYANVTRGEDGAWASGCEDQLPAGSLLTAPPFAGRSKGWGIVEFETPEEVRVLVVTALMQGGPEH
jgi:RNA recognition motif-containing protein